MTVVHHQHELAIEIHSDQKKAPRYNPTTPFLRVERVVVTEKATTADLPIVDFQLLNEQTGETFFAVLTGRQINALSAVIKGTNLRNHGVEEP